MFAWTQRLTGMSVYGNIITLWEAKILSAAQVVCINDENEQVSFYSDILQEVTIMLWSNVDEIPVYFNMPSNYTTNDVDADSAVIKT
jgi:hypothetical protein